VNLAAALLLAAFMALWILPMLWVLRKRSSAEQAASTWQRAGVPLTIYTVLFLVAAWWWHVPLSTQKSLAQFASAPALPPLAADCEQLQEVIASVQDQSGGRLAIDRSGSVRVEDTLWSALPSVQRRGLQELAKQVAGCSGNSGPPPIRDMTTGSPLIVQ
jgi:hypothetical protein